MKLNKSLGFMVLGVFAANFNSTNIANAQISVFTPRNIENENECELREQYTIEFLDEVSDHYRYKIAAVYYIFENKEKKDSRFELLNEKGEVFSSFKTFLELKNYAKKFLKKALGIPLANFEELKAVKEQNKEGKYSQIFYTYDEGMDDLQLRDQHGIVVARCRTKAERTALVEKLRAANVKHIETQTELNRLLGLGKAYYAQLNTKTGTLDLYDENHYLLVTNLSPKELDHLIEDLGVWVREWGSV